MTLQEYVNTLKDKKIAVIGIGVSNEPLIELLLKNGCHVTACDKRTMQEMGEEGKKLKAMARSSASVRIILSISIRTLSSERLGSCLLTSTLKKQKRAALS